MPPGSAHRHPRAPRARRTRPTRRTRPRPRTRVRIPSRPRTRWHPPSSSTSRAKRRSPRACAHFADVTDPRVRTTELARGWKISEKIVRIPPVRGVGANRRVVNPRIFSHTASPDPHVTGSGVLHLVRAQHDECFVGEVGVAHLGARTTSARSASAPRDVHDRRTNETNRRCVDPRTRARSRASRAAANPNLPGEAGALTAPRARR